MYPSVKARKMSSRKRTFSSLGSSSAVALAAELFPYMQAVRFLWDYLCGDHYWKCRYEEHNLDRARNQWRLFLQVKAHERMMSDYITTLLQPTTRHLST